MMSNEEKIEKLEKRLTNTRWAILLYGILFTFIAIVNDARSMYRTYQQGTVSIIVDDQIRHEMMENDKEIIKELGARTK